MLDNTPSFVKRFSGTSSIAYCQLFYTFSYKDSADTNEAWSDDMSFAQYQFDHQTSSSTLMYEVSESFGLAD